MNFVPHLHECKFLLCKVNPRRRIELLATHVGRAGGRLRCFVVHGAGCDLKPCMTPRNSASPPILQACFTIRRSSCIYCLEDAANTCGCSQIGLMTASIAEVVCFCRVSSRTSFSHRQRLQRTNPCATLFCSRQDLPRLLFSCQTACSISPC